MTNLTSHSFELDENWIFKNIESSAFFDYLVTKTVKLDKTIQNLIY